MPGITTREVAIRRIGSTRLNGLRECVAGAWTDYKEGVRPLFDLISATAEATVVHELVAQRVRRRFTGATGTEVLEPGANGRFLLHVREFALIQFKKLDENLLPSNYPTHAARDFDAQVELEGFPPLQRLTLGYQLDHFRSEIAGVYLTLRLGRDCAWHHNLVTGEHSTELDFRFAASRADTRRVAEPRREVRPTSRKRKGA